jgi:hypothetical protein
MPALGTLPAEWLDSPLLAGALRKVSSGAQLGALSLQYGDPAGELRLRRALALKLADFGVSAAPGADRHRGRRDPRARHRDAHAGARRRQRAGRRAGWSVEYARLPRSACACCRCRAARTVPTSPRWSA